MPGKTLVVFGAGAGIGNQIAATFAVRGLTHVSLVSRSNLDKNEDFVLSAIQERGYSCQVKTWQCDLSNLDQLKVVLKELESFGSLECVLYNAARVGGKPPLEEDVKDIENDFRTTNLGLYEVAQWAIPLLKQNTSATAPSLFVTSTSQLYKEPHYDLFSLSMVKSAQRALVLALHHHFGKDVHIALISIGGVVSRESKRLNPENIADKAWELYKQPKGDWKREIEINE